MPAPRPAEFRRRDIELAGEKAKPIASWRKATYFRILSAELDGSLLQARRHHHHAGDIDQAIDASYTVRNQLHTLGAWAWEHDLCTETLTWLPDKTHDRAALIHQLGMIAKLRGTTRRPNSATRPPSPSLRRSATAAALPPATTKSA